ncbi:hypothetical protein AS149_25145 [Burkholderia cenocepacia]|nr:hypothetical protein AS149_25145 [Burkholderia cenocepacia]
MERKAPAFDKHLFVSRSELAQARVDATIRRARELAEDVQREERLSRQLCRACHYFTRFAGAAMTRQPCACCNVPQTFGSTNVDVLCMDCAQAHALCKHCGGDIEMRTERGGWPTDPKPAA